MKKIVLPALISTICTVPATIMPLTSCGQTKPVRQVTFSVEVVGGHGTVEISSISINEYTPFDNAIQMVKVKPDRGYKVHKWVDANGNAIKKDYLIENDFHAKVSFIHNTFEEDTWDSICIEANKGLDNLKTVYSLETFIGLEKTIKLNTIEHKIRVIGEEHDNIVDETTQKLTGKTAALTFELVTLWSIPDEKKPGVMLPRWDLENAKNYLNSCLRYSISNEGGAKDDPQKKLYSLTKPCIEIMKDSEPILFENLKCVQKRKNIFTTKPDWCNYSAKLFAPSSDELGYTSNMQEGEVYSYWSTHKSPESRIKKDINGVAQPYWTSTTNKNLPEDGQYLRSISITADGKWNDKTYAYYNCCINFAFCI